MVSHHEYHFPNPKVQKNTVLTEREIPTSALFGHLLGYDITDI